MERAAYLGRKMCIRDSSLEDGCEAELFRDGYEADFNDGVILENGSYELRIYKAGAEQGGSGVFHFTVEN